MGASVKPEPVDPIAAYKAKYATPAPATADPIAAYKAKYATQPTKPSSGLLGAAEAATQGLLGGFADEIGGAGAAAIDAGDNLLHGKPANFSQNYQLYRDTARGLDQGYAQAHPVLHAGAEIAGSVPSMLLGSAAVRGALSAAPAVSGALQAAGKAAPLLTKIGTGAALGAATSAVYGAGNATGDRLAGAEQAAKEGGVLGAALPALGAAGRGAGRLTGRLVRAVTGTGNEARALSSLSDVLAQAKMTPDEFAASAAADKAAGSPVMAADALGDAGKKLVRWTMNQPAQGASDLRQALTDRNEGQYDRILAGAKNAVGQDVANVPETRDALLAAKRAHAQPLYAAAHADPDFTSETLDAAMQLPQFKKALEAGQNLAYHDDLSQAIAEGKPLPSRPQPIGSPDPQVRDANAALASAVKNDPGINVEKLAKALGADPESLTGSGTPAKGTPVPVKVLDYAQRYLQNGIRKGFDSQSGFEHSNASATSRVLGHVLDELDAARPNFAKARAVYHSDSVMQEAADLGEKALSMPPDELAAATKDLSPSQLDVFRSTALSALKQKAGSVADRNDLSKQFLANPAMRERFKIIAPTEDAYNALAGLSGRESKMAGTLAAGTGNSTTAAQLGMNQAMTGPISPTDVMVLPLSPHRAEIRLAAKFGTMLNNRSNVKLADALAPMLKAEPGTPEFDALVEALKNNPSAAASLPPASPLRQALTRGTTATASGRQRP